MKVEPYLNFDGRCDEAIEFYKKTLGAEVTMLMRFKDSPVAPPPGMSAPGTENMVMHSSLRIGDSTVMASDGRCQRVGRFDGTALTISVTTDAQAEKIFNALSDGGTVSMPLAKTFYSSRFGMLNDRFGVPWMVIVAQ